MKKEMFLNAEDEAKRIIKDHTSGYMRGVFIYPDEVSEEDITEIMYEDCSYILTKDLLDGKYTLKQYVAIRNELGKLIFSFLEN